MNQKNDPGPPRKQRDAGAVVMIHEAATGWVARRDAGLNASEEAEFKAWLAAEPRHRAAFAEYGSAWAMLDRPVRGGVANDVLQEVQALDRQQRRRRRMLSGAAAMALLLASVPLWTHLSERTGTDHQAIAATAKVLLPARQILPDGSVVELKEGAEIVPDFGPAHRRVALRRGEAHFEVAKDAGRPFVVEVNGLEVRAVGTAFAVQSGDSAIEVIVTQGRVAVEKSAATPAVASAAVAPQRSAGATLDAGQHAVIAVESAVADVRTIERDELSERLAWRAPRLELSGTPLSEIVRLLNQHATGRQKTRFLIGDHAIAEMRVSGLFRADNTAALMDLLDSGFGITAERRGESEIVLRRAAPPR